MKSFSVARLKLTLWYMLISYSLLGLFTFAVISAERQAFAQVIELVHSHVRGVVFNVYLQQQIEQFERHFATWLILFDGVILVAATIASYFLSGRTLEPIERTMKAQEQFVGDVSHELRTPLANMDVRIEAYNRGRRSLREANQTIDVVHSEVARMSSLVDGLLRLVRAEQGRQTNNTEETTDVAQALHESIERFEANIKAKQLTLSMDVAQRSFVKAKEAEVGQVLMILLDNAVKYVPTGGRLAIVLRRVPDIEFTIFNSGEGIGAEDLPYVFDRFYRGQNAGDEGVGLGLAIARQIVESQRGTVAVASQPDSGVTFKVTWPAT